tara:strand:- start:48 stop:1487 length:1440 start_codon:yes stop_codon:yes gene_type:complete
MASARTGFEPTEIFTATAMFFTTSELNAVKSDITKLVEFFDQAKSKLSKVEFGTTQDRNVFSSYYDLDEGQAFPSAAHIQDMARGISAALSIKEWLGGSHTREVTSNIAQTVYMTGKVWPDEVEVLNVPSRGFKSYNSSDIIIKPVGMPKGYYGVSLKKKPKVDDVDPTMINKAFDTVLQGKEFDDVKEEIVDVRAEYFGKLVKEAARIGHINLKTTGRTNKWLFSGHGPDDRVIHNMDKDRAFIDTKGSMKMKEIIGPKDKGYEDDPDSWGNAHPKFPGWDNYGDSKLDRSKLRSRKDTMRAWVNKQLATDRTLYDKMLGVMNRDADMFAEQLIAVTMRTDVLEVIKKKLKVEGIGNLNIGFALVTGIGYGKKLKEKNIKDKDSLLTVPTGHAVDIKCVLTGLQHLDAPKNEYEFKVKTKEEPHVDDDGPAKLIFDLIKNKKPVMNMELRFKGGFTSQPQFFGTMTKEFKQVLQGECL